MSAVAVGSTLLFQFVATLQLLSVVPVQIKAGDNQFDAIPDKAKLVSVPV